MDSAWRQLHNLGLETYGHAILAAPTRFRARAEAFVAELATSRRILDRIRVLGVEDPRIEAFERRYRILASGLRSHVGFEGPPVLLVVGGIALTGGAIAWAVAAYQYAVHLREHTALLEKELRARVEASTDGRVLAPSTLMKSSSWPLFAVGAAMAGVVVWAWRSS